MNLLPLLALALGALHCLLLTVIAIEFRLLRLGDNAFPLYDVWKEARERRKKRRNRDFV